MSIFNVKRVDPATEATIRILEEKQALRTLREVVPFNEIQEFARELWNRRSPSPASDAEPRLVSYGLNFETCTLAQGGMEYYFDLRTDSAGNEYASDAERRDGWISVKERLPDQGTDVLIFNGNYQRVACIRGPKASFMDRRTMQILSPRPTHWMQLPTPPAAPQPIPPSVESAERMGLHRNADVFGEGK